MPSHQLAPHEAALQLDLLLVLPGVESTDDGCIGRLETRLREQTGISGVHPDVSANGHTVLCLHYDPNLVPLEKLERMARDEGTAITDRFRHETLGVKGMDCASCAASIEHVIRKLDGVLSVTVNYPTEKLKVEYDSQHTSRAKIVRSVSRLGYRVPGSSAPVRAQPPSHDHENQDAPAQTHGEDDGHDHGDAGNSWIKRNRELALALSSGRVVGHRLFRRTVFGIARHCGARILSDGVRGGRD